jgi:outer membrane lipoprotein SlyB
MNTTLRITAATALLASLALAGCATTAPGYGDSGYGGGYSSASCRDCGTVQSIENVGRTPNATGASMWIAHSKLSKTCCPSPVRISNALS